MYIQLVIVVALTISLSDVVAYHAVHNINFSDAVHTGRYRRLAQSLTPQQKWEIVHHHNALRASEGADNMELITWNDFLASLAEIWAANCSRNPGQWNPGDGGEMPLADNRHHTSIGHNLRVTSGSAISLIQSIDAWYDEKANFNYDTLGCTPGKMCEHFIQVVWAASRHVGCAYRRCEPLTGSSSKATYLVCIYDPPAENYISKPFTKGPACSKCGNGAGWCKDKLCNSDCSCAGENCSCKAICYNCAELDMDTCRCSCADGWGGTDCSVALDPHAVAGQCPPILAAPLLLPQTTNLSSQTTFVMSQMLLVMATIALVVSNSPVRAPGAVVFC